MNKLTCKLLPLFVISLLAFPVYAEEAAEDEFKNPSSPEELLELVQKGQFADTQEQRDRERQFRNEKNKQAKLLADAKAERARLEREAARLEVKFEANEALLVVAEVQLKERLGSLNEIFGHLAGLATESRNIFEQSISSAQFGKEREEFLTKLAVKMGRGVTLASIPELERLWFELQREINATGEVVKFTTDVIALDGTVESREVVRVGVFNAVSDGNYLTYASTRGMYEELPSQPARRYTSTTSDVLDAEAFPVQFAVDPTGPQGGSYLASLIAMPGWGERTQQGGVVGYIILYVLGLGGLGLFGWRLYSLMGIRSLIDSQLAASTLSTDNPLGRVLKVAEDNPKADTETIELKMAEQILNERPPIEKLNWLIKLISIVAPLMGLFGTIIGMIITFQMITLFGTGDPKTMAEGISIALVTTWLGLAVAIPMTFMSAIVSNFSKGILETIEEQAIGMAAERSEQ
ncbi:MAG TPA: MotA/TolQ/ExbB proton channel family protein [Gammaproteobacteria bacterium]|nr:MotA/TolQ/ExbB proton channel family protein [Gammaproteobacteria bacterium]HIO43264.1 MotA/TolQ/ExbB proton channel family protein [Gammaproteobacteria bacterium]